MPNAYSNRELDSKFEQIMGVLQRIETQGQNITERLSALEIWKETLMAKITTIVAGFGVLWLGVKEFLLK